MLISKETLKELSAQGIQVRWYPEDSYEEFVQHIWQKCYERAFNYGKDHVQGSDAATKGLANVLYNTMEEFEKHCKQMADSFCKRDADPYNFDTLFITFDTDKVVVKKEPVKSKQITTDYVLRLVEKGRKTYSGTYGDFARAMQRICKERGYNGRLCVYPTTYGIGVWLLWNYKAEEQVADIEQIMKQRGIEYYNEYSDARYVYRFKVSKKRENLEKIYK